LEAIGGALKILCHCTIILQIYLAATKNKQTNKQKSKTAIQNMEYVVSTAEKYKAAMLNIKWNLVL